MKKLLPLIIFAGLLGHQSAHAQTTAADSAQIRLQQRAADAKTTLDTRKQETSISRGNVDESKSQVRDQQNAMREQKRQLKEQKLELARQQDAAKEARRQESFARDASRLEKQRVRDARRTTPQ